MSEAPAAPGSLRDAQRHKPMERPIGVCYLIDDLRTGGTETQLLQLIRRLDRTKVLPHLCLLDGTSATSQELEPTDCPVVRLGIRKLLSHRTLLKGREFAKLLRSWQIDVLQVHFPDSTYFGVAVARWAGVPCVVRTRRDLFYWVTPTHRRLGRYLDRLYNRFFVDAMIVNSEAVRDAALLHEQPAARRIEVIPNGLDLDLFQRLRPRSLGGAPVRIGIVSMLRPEKRVDLFIEAAKKVALRKSDAEFLVAGEGPERQRLETMIAHAGLRDRVRLLGAVHDVPSFLAQLDIGVLCSDTEGLSNALAEYMAAGLPIVATAVGGNLELLRHGQTALLTPPADSDKLAGAIVQLIEQPEQRARMGEQAKSAAERRLDMGAAAEHHQIFYRNLLLDSVRGHASGGVRKLVLR